MHKRLGFVGIIVHDRVANAPKVNKVLTEYGEHIIARTGLPYKEKDCSVITLVVDMTTDEVGALTGKLGAIEGITVKSALSKE